MRWREAILLGQYAVLLQGFHQTLFAEFLFFVPERFGHAVFVAEGSINHWLEPEPLHEELLAAFLVTNPAGCELS